MDIIESRFAPLARRFVWRFLEGQLAGAKSVIFTEAGSEVERIAIIVEALKQTNGSRRLTDWIQGWFIIDETPAEEGAAQKVINDRRTFRIGETYRKGDPVRIDGQFSATVVEESGDKGAHEDKKPGKIRVRFEAKGKDPETLVISRHRLTHV